MEAAAMVVLFLSLVAVLVNLTVAKGIWRKSNDDAAPDAWTHTDSSSTWSSSETGCNPPSEESSSDADRNDPLDDASPSDSGDSSGDGDSRGTS